MQQWLQYIHSSRKNSHYILWQSQGFFAATGHINYAKLYLHWSCQTNILGYISVLDFIQFVEAVGAGLWTDLVIEQVMMRSIKSHGGLTEEESVRLQWIYSMHKCAGIHDAMTTMTNLKNKAIEQHIELGSSRCKRDFQDLVKIQEWFDQHEPFEGKLRSLSSGLT